MSDPKHESNASPDPEALARWADQTLRALPLRRAPSSLEVSVLAQLAHAAKPWWMRSFKHWPAAARAIFLILSVGFARLAMLAGDRLVSPIEQRLPQNLAPDLTWFQIAVNTTSTVIDSVPALWLYLGLGVLAGLYALFFGLSAVAYRALYAGR